MGHTAACHSGHDQTLSRTSPHPLFTRRGQAMPSGPRFPVSIHLGIKNKPIWREEYGTDWRQGELTAEELVGHWAAGRAWIAARMTSAHRSSDAFAYSDLAVVDIDHGLRLEEFRQHPLASQAMALYTTASHSEQSHRFRVIFRLPTRLHDSNLYQVLNTLLIRELKADGSCSDCCRIFYSCDTGIQQLLNPEATLSADWIQRAEQELEDRRRRLREASDSLDPLDLERAEFVLADVLPPTADGQRDLFIRVTAAAASAGEALYPAWSDWASRGHHGTGKNARQTSERFFRGFSGRSTLATLFFLAGEAEQGWRRRLPDHLRSVGSGPSLPAAGYSHEDFLGEEDDCGSGVSTLASPSLLDADPSDWGQPATTAPVAPAAETQETNSDQQGAAESQSQGAGGKGGKPKPSSNDPVERIRARLNLLYPDLRLNQLTLKLEYGPRERPQIIHDPSTTYIRLSRGTGDVLQKTLVYDTAQVIAYEHRYNPIASYLEHCRKEAQPIDYLDSVASALLGVEPEGPDNPRMPCGTPYADLVLKRFLVGAVARALDPGCRHPWMPILIGPQNVGKTNFFEYLVPPDPLSGLHTWAATIQQSLPTLREKPHMLHAGWIVLFDEVERYFQRRHVEDLKNLLSVSVDISKRVYENERSFQRAFVLAGASNSRSFLIDPTGNRRFMPVIVKGKVPSREDPSIQIVDLDRLKLDRDRIWAAAYQAYLDEPVHDFSSYELSCLRDYVSTFEADHPLGQALQGALARGCTFIYEGGPAYTTAWLFDQLDLRIDSPSALSRALGEEMQKLGFRNVQRRVTGEKRRFWIRDTANAPPKRKPWDT